MNWIESKSELILKIAVCLTMISSLVGCSGGSGSSVGGGIKTPSAAKNIYVIQNSLTFPLTPGSVLQFSATASGSISPQNTITAPAGNDFQGLATDAEGNLYVAANSQTTSTLLEYSPGANGSATPIRSIPSNNTTRMWNPDGLAISPTGQVIVGEDNGGVATYSASANGSVAPDYYILGAAQTGGGLSTLNAAQDVAVGSAGNLYVFNWQDIAAAPAIDIFSASATGNVAPTGNLSGPATTIEGVGGIATDSSGNLYVSNNGANGGSILVFAPTASGNVAPIRAITGASTQLNRSVGGIQVDAVGNIYVITAGASGSNPAVLKFAATATGDTAPVLSITSTGWTYPDNYLSLTAY
jgi:hypothetical protein